jgi:YD repeat-containing protein
MCASFWTAAVPCRFEYSGSNTPKPSFDPIGNLTNVVYPNSGSIVLGYDYANRLTNMMDRVGTSGFSWTAAGQLAGEDGP